MASNLLLLVNTKTLLTRYFSLNVSSANYVTVCIISHQNVDYDVVFNEETILKIMLRLCLSLTYVSCQYLKNFVLFRTKITSNQ